MIKRIVEMILYFYWIVMNAIGLFGICQMSCGLTLGNIAGSLLYSALIIIPGLFFIYKSFKKEWFRKWWTYLIYFALIMYPYMFVQSAQSMLCGCSINF